MAGRGGRRADTPVGFGQGRRRHGIRLAILGLHNCQDSTVLHMHASSPRSDAIYGPDELYAWAMMWVRDSGGRWHAAEPGHRLDRAARRRTVG